MYRLIGFLLDDGCSIADVDTGNHVADFDFYQIASPQLAVDREIKKGLVPQSAFAIEMKADRLNLLLRQRTLCSDILTSVPGRAMPRG